MNGRYIFDTRSRYIGTIEKAGREARKMKYRFLLFNDAVYYVDDDGKTYETGLLKNDIFFYL